MFTVLIQKRSVLAGYHMCVSAQSLGADLDLRMEWGDCSGSLCVECPTGTVDQEESRLLC